MPCRFEAPAHPAARSAWPPLADKPLVSALGLLCDRHVLGPERLDVGQKTREWMTHSAGMSPARPRIRTCPLCGLAMQASKSHEQAAEFDRFDCLACHTTIVERPAEQDAPKRKR